MGRYDRDIRAWRDVISKNKARAVALFKSRHSTADPEVSDVRSEISFLRAQSERLQQFIRDYRRRGDLRKRGP
jgi:hypothetical protein